MRWLFAVFFAAVLFAGKPPFWEAKAPADWTDVELEELLTVSPWAQKAVSGSTSEGVQVYLATAQPMRMAEAELARRAAEKEKEKKHRGDAGAEEDPTAEEYAEFLRDNEGEYIVVAVQVRDNSILEDPAEFKRMQDQCILKVGGKRYNMVGHFAPSPSDAMLRLVFPRAVTASDKRFRIELYIPGTKFPYSLAEFRVEELKFKGALAM